jgi:amino acid transporter
LSAWDGVAFLVGIVIGIGIFKTPQLVAANVDSSTGFIGLWLLGGLITLVGALCYAELGAARPDPGGEYRFLADAYGRPLSVLFGWARGTVIQTGAIAAVAFVFGDYANQLYSLGPYGPAIYAALVIVGATAVNVIGTPQSTLSQNLFTLLTVAALLAVIVAGFAAAVRNPVPAQTALANSSGAAGLALVFILLTYGGWNEAAYLSGELKDVGRNMARVLLTSTVILTALYGLTNYAYLAAFGLEGLRASDAVAADLMRRVAGGGGAAVLSLIVCVCALSTLNATIFTGARTYYALGRDLSALRRLGSWHAQGQTPLNALLLQGAIALALVAFGAVTRDGFKAMVEYTAPVFWFFLLLVGLSVFVMRWREPHRQRPFRVPLYPLTPALFVATCGFMLYSSVMYTGMGAMVGIAVVLLGLPLLLLEQTRPAATPAE